MDDLVKQTIQDLKFSNGKGIFTDDIARLEQAIFKKKPFIFPWHQSMTTIDNTIWLARNFNNPEQWKEVARRSVFIHESWHLKQYADGKFSISEYLTHRVTRFKLEIEAEQRETLYRCYIGNITRSNLGEYAIRMANEWPKQYWITSLKTIPEWNNLFRNMCLDAFKILEAI